MRQKRGGGAAFVSIEASGENGGIPLESLPDGRSPEMLFDRQWAEALLARVLARLEDHYNFTDCLSLKFQVFFINIAEPLMLSRIEFRRLRSLV